MDGNFKRVRFDFLSRFRYTTGLYIEKSCYKSENNENTFLYTAAVTFLKWYKQYPIGWLYTRPKIMNISSSLRVRFNEQIHCVRELGIRMTYVTRPFFVVYTHSPNNRAVDPTTSGYQSPQIRRVHTYKRLSNVVERWQRVLPILLCTVNAVCGIRRPFCTAEIRSVGFDPVAVDVPLNRPCHLAVSAFCFRRVARGRLRTALRRAGGARSCNNIVVAVRNARFFPYFYYSHAYTMYTYYILYERRKK